MFPLPRVKIPWSTERQVATSSATIVGINVALVPPISIIQVWLLIFEMKKKMDEINAELDMVE